MKAVFFLCALVVAVHARPEEQYTDKYDDLNIEEIIGNKRLFSGYFNCAMDKGPCTSEGKELRSHISDALATNCSKCTPKQKKGTRFVIGHLINKEPEYWKQLCAKYDPEGKYAPKFEKELKKVA